MEETGTMLGRGGEQELELSTTDMEGRSWL